MKVEINAEGHTCYLIESINDLTLLEPDQVAGALADLHTAIRYTQEMRVNASIFLEAIGTEPGAIDDAGIEMNAFQWIDDGEYGVNAPTGTRLTLNDEELINVQHPKTKLHVPSPLAFDVV